VLSFALNIVRNSRSLYDRVIAKVGIKVLVVEEAGEVLKSHLLSVLVPSIQHLIQIGDHLQLRPQITCYSLSVDSKQGAVHRLDESMFERLTRIIPTSLLNTQRRMRPQISSLIRNHLYPLLEDDSSVLNYPKFVFPQCPLSRTNSNFFE
jgi:superfamily I DNA and/or RNA helicase